MKGLNDKQLVASWIENELKPTHYAVITLKQGQYTDAGGYNTWVKGTRDIFAGQYRRFIKNFSIEIYGKTNWRRHRKFIANAATLEGDGLGQLTGSWHAPGSVAFLQDVPGGGKRAHINVLLRKPEFCSEFAFTQKFRNCWTAMEWSKPNIYIEKRTGDCVGYSLKEGTETLLTDALSF